MIDFSKHPVSLVPHFNEAVGSPFSYEFSRYIYTPQSTKDERESLLVAAGEVAERLPILLAALGVKQELALHSRLLAGGKEWHIPMMDFLGELREQDLPAISRWVEDSGIAEYELYSTGRSAHLYGLTLVSREELSRFFARALLLNLPGAAPVTDSRWIGHRLLAGYGSLRWSCHTKQYLGLPARLGRFSAKA